MDGIPLVRVCTEWFCGVLGRLYALQTALAIDKTSKESKLFLVSLMDWLEKQKIALKDNDMITNETAAQAHFENYAIKLFNLADGMDRQTNYNKYNLLNR